MYSFADTLVNTWEGWYWWELGPGLREGGGRERGSLLQPKGWGPPAWRRRLMSDVELDVRAGPRQKTDWEDQEESGLGVSLPTRPYLLQNLGVQQTQRFLLHSSCLLSANIWGSHKLWLIPACSLSRSWWAISIPGYSAFQAQWN